MNDTTSITHDDFIEQLRRQTVAALQSAQGNSVALHSAINEYFLQALANQISLEKIEDILGVDEPCIMDLADLSEDDEEIVIDAFEDLLATHSTQ